MMAEADSKSAVLKGEGSALEHSVCTDHYLPLAPAANQSVCLALAGGSEEKEPGEDKEKEGDASGSGDLQARSSSLDGKATANLH